MNSYFHWTISNQLSFNRTFGDHSVNAVAVYEAEKQGIQTSQIVGTGTAGDDKIRTTKGKTIDLTETYNNKYAYTFASWLVRAQYSYKGRYMVSASIRGDGSSRFAPNTRWGYFPAASVGWRMSDESFLRDVKWLDDLKLRASVGQTGNAQIGNSEYLALYGIDEHRSRQRAHLTGLSHADRQQRPGLGEEHAVQRWSGCQPVARHPRIHRRLLLFEDDRHAVRRSRLISIGPHLVERQHRFNAE